MWDVKCWIGDFGLGISDFGFWISDFGFWNEDVVCGILDIILNFSF